MKKSMVLVVCIGLIGGFVAPANAGMIVAWDFGTGEGTTSAQNTAASFVDPNVTATTLTRSENLPSTNFVLDYDRTIANAELAELSVSADAPVVGSKGLGTAAGGILRSESLQEEPTADRYFTFSIEPSIGYQMTVTELSFDTARAGTWNNRAIAVSFSLDGFETSTSIGGALLTPHQSIDSYTFAKATFDLSGVAALENIPAGTTLDLRFYPYTGDGSGTWVVIDNLTLSGSVIPEPASVALLGLGLLAGAWFRRRCC